MTAVLRLLVVEDEPALARLLQASLGSEGYQVEIVSSGQEGLARATGGRYEVVLLDLTLRDVQAIDMLTQLRQEGVTTPILAIGDRTGPAHVVRALDAGADEYVTKPVNPDEIAARVRALVRRAAPVPPTVLTFANVALNVVTHQAFVSGLQLHVTPKEFSLLHTFLRRHGEVISRSELLERVWEMHFDPGSNVVDVHVSRLRSKLHQAGATVVIEAVRGAGFHFAARQGPAESNVVA
jgi:DNA-binding response OmpR family regulator